MSLPSSDRCCGCAACLDSCAFGAIAMEADDEGFRYPRVDAGKCRQCGRCETVCPVLHPKAVGQPRAVYAARVKDDAELLKSSSSGGLFSLLAERTLEQGGVVIGAVWDQDWTVVHRSAENAAGVAAMRGAKYLQSKVEGCYSEVRRLLDSGRPVLFSGMPCQVAALRNFLGRESDLLLTVELICHAIPSPKVWQAFLRQYPGELKAISLRDKTLGWPRSISRLDYADGTVRKLDINAFVIAFLTELCNRPSCLVCPARAQFSAADVTLGDFHGIEKVAPELNDGRGVSCVLVRTGRGARALKAVQGRCELRMATYAQVRVCNPNLEMSFPAHPLRRIFIRRSLTCSDFNGWVKTCVSARGLRRMWLRALQFFTTSRRRR